jgi:hypothetical protein
MNKLPILDKGYVALFSRSMSNNEFIDARTRLFKGRNDIRLIDCVQVHVSAYTPLFIKLSLIPSNITCFDYPSRREPDAYIPTVAEINSSKSLEHNERISEDIRQTTQALLLNPKAYTMDGCDSYVAQTITPISVYSEYLATASLSTWISYINRDYNSLVKPFAEAVRDILLAEWPNLRDEIDVAKEKGR